MYESQQVQRVYDSDGHEEEVLSGDDTSVCDSSGSLPESVCGGDLIDLSDEAMDTLNKEGVDGCEEVSARHALTVTSHAQNVGDEILESEGKSSDNDDDINLALDDVQDNEGDKFSATGFIHDEDIIREDAGVRGPQSTSMLYPQDCKKLVQVCRGIKVIQEFDSNMNAFQMEKLREDANFIHDDIFNMLVIYVPDMFKLHR